MSDETHVTHGVLERFAENRINIPSAQARRRREQVGYLRARLEAHIAAHPDFDLVKLRASGSTAKHTAIKSRSGEGSDADVAAYLSNADPDIDEKELLDWLCERCKEVYGKTKVADDFVISQHAVGITLRGSGLKVDVAPVLYFGEEMDKGFLVTREGKRVLTSVTLHLQFLRGRTKVAGPGYLELIRLLKAWIREAKLRDGHLRCKSFLIELVVAHLWDTGWRGSELQVDDYPVAFEQVLSYIAATGLLQPIMFDDFYSSDEVAATSEPIQIWDPVNAENNVARGYTDADRRRLVDCAASALDSVNWAAMAPTQGAAHDAWREVFSPTFPGE